MGGRLSVQTESGKPAVVIESWSMKLESRAALEVARITECGELMSAWFAVGTIGLEVWSEWSHMGEGEARVILSEEVALYKSHIINQIISVCISIRSPELSFHNTGICFQ